MESEFFGYKKGAFTGANADKPGFLDKADMDVCCVNRKAETNA